MSLFSILSHLLYPDKCIFCQKLLTRTELHLCTPCLAKLPSKPVIKKKIPFLSDTTVLWYYEGDVRNSLLRFKFNGKRSYAQAYARFLAIQLYDRLDQFDVITWVPVSTQRKWKRGYDQMELITYALCEYTQRKPSLCIKKVRHNPAQSTAHDVSQRRANVRNVYQVRNPSEVTGKRILLLDDIITTGATISECAKVLMFAGAKKVSGAAIAAPKQ